MSAFRERASRVWTIARRELKAMFDHPTGYVLLVVFIAANAFLFFRQAYLNGQATLRPMLDLLPWLFLFFIPAVSMRVIAEETRAGTLEVVLTQPIDEFELLAGKYLGAVVLLIVALALTLPIPLGLSFGSELRWGPIVAQYAGTALLAMGLSAVGVWASTVARSQITAFILAVAVTFVLVLVGLDPLIVGLPPALGAVAARLGVLSHFESMGRGVIDLRDVVYFLSLIGFFLALAYGSLLRRRLAPAGAAARTLRLGVAVMAAGFLVVNLAGGYIGGRLDLTPGNAYTLSSASRQIASGVDDIVTIKVFASDELPTGIALMKRDMDDLLRDLRSASRGKVRVVTRNPAADTAAETEARQAGIGPVQFNVIGQSELQLKEGYLGLLIQYGDRREAIPFVNRTDDLEYRIATAIRGMTRPSKPVLGLVDAASQPDPYARGGPLDAVREALSQTYDVRSISLSDASQPAPEVATLVLAGTPDSLPADALERLRAFFGRGGAALVLTSGMELSPQMPMAMPRPVAWNALLGPFGVSVKSDMVYDLAASEVVPVPTSFGMRVLQRYPFFARAQSTTASVVNAELSSVLTPWPSSIDTTASPSWRHTPLLVTSGASGSLTGPTMIEPTRDYPRDSLAPRLVAVQVAPESDSARGRLIVVASSQIVTGNFAQAGGGAFVLNAIDWLAQDEALIAIRSKDTRPPAIAFESQAARDAVKYANVIGVPALTALAGLAHLARRRRRTRGLQPGTAPEPSTGGAGAENASMGGVPA